MQRKWIYLPVVVLGLCGYGVIYNEARKEIFYLCQNFISGMPKVIVEEQLSTVSFSRVREVHARKIIMDSGVNLFVHRCSIDFSLDRKVVTAAYTSF